MHKYNELVYINTGFWQGHSGRVQDYREHSGEYLVYLSIDESLKSAWVHGNNITVESGGRSDEKN